MSKKMVAWFKDIDKHDISLVGGKGANLGEMYRAKFPIPYGFVVTSHAYFAFIEANKLTETIKNHLLLINYENPKELSDASKAIRALILKSHIPKHIMNEVVNFYEELGTPIGGLFKPPLVAVRSSATAEDLPEASFAGQQETYLNVVGENHLLHKMREAWASLFTERAMYYRNTNKFDHMSVGIAAVVQKMVQSDQSGIAFSIDPLTNDKRTITIEAIYGLGEYIVGGKVTPDHYEVDKVTHSIKKIEVKRQFVKLVKKGQSNVEVKIDKNAGEQQKISDETIIELAKVVQAIEKHYFFPQDIEWAVESGQVYIVQSRPITTMDDVTSKKAMSGGIMPGSKVLLKGDPASPGVKTGIPVIITSPSQIGKVKTGDILVAPQTNPDYVPAMKRAAAIITERGGRTSHAAIVSRELGIPAIVGAPNATIILKHEKIITVNGATGEIFKGKVARREPETIAASSKSYKKIKTLTKMYVNLAEPEQAEKVAKLDVDGVGLLRAEFMIAGIGTHPKVFVEKKRESEFIDMLAKKLEIFAKAFAPRPIIYRATDFKTNEYRHLKGGEQYEPLEENPMIGLRGASRYIADKKVFMMELSALKKVRDAGYKNVNLMIPFVRVPAELHEIKQLIEYSGLSDLPSFKLWIMVEVPSAVLLLEDFIKEGIDGVSIGSNDLTMLIMGVDRDNEEIAHLYDERNPAVLWAFEHIIKTCRKHDVTVSMCGQAPSDYPELLDSLIRWGVTSVSINPDVVERTRETIHEVEKKLWQK